MLQASDRGYVIVDHKRHNRSIKQFLTEMAIRTPVNQRISQVVDLVDPPAAPHIAICVDTLKSLKQEILDGTIHSIFDVSAGRASAGLLTALTHSADLSGLKLQNVHVDVGRYLAHSIVDLFPYNGLVEVEEFAHVQGTRFRGVVSSSRVVILGLMRAGDPMARGVYEVFPRARYSHYVDTYNDMAWSKVLTPFFERTDEPFHVIVVDAVINRGGTIRRVIQELQNLSCSSRMNVYALSRVMQRRAATDLPLEFPRVRFDSARFRQPIHRLWDYRYRQPFVWRNIG